MFDLGPSWQKILEDEVNRPYMFELHNFLANERLVSSVYPPEELVFNALKSTSYEDVKVVLIGQDPYHGAGQAHGLCFSVPHGIAFPPSLRNIIKELKSDVQISDPLLGSLQTWADQGVLLLNTLLTVRDGQPLSHQGQGWERFTDAVIEVLAKKERPLIFILWGKSAQAKCKIVFNTHHYVLTAPHPSPLSAHQGFLGCKHFSKTNELLIHMDKTPIDWSI